LKKIMFLMKENYLLILLQNCCEMLREKTSAVAVMYHVRNTRALLLKLAY